jgi:hypothetical protein
MISVLFIAATVSAGPTARPAINRLRGGDLAGIPAATVAKVGATLVGINGVYVGLAPEPASKAYGLDSASFEMTEIIKNIGYTFASMAIAALVQLNGGSFANAFGWANVPWLLLTLGNLLDGTSAKMGIPAAGTYLLLAINAAGTYCGLTNTGMPLAALLNAVWCGFNGLFFALLPSKGLEAWGLASDSKTDAVFKNFGYALASFGVMTAALAKGADVTTAFAYSCIAFLVGLGDMLFVSKTFDALGSPKEPGYAWIAIMAAVAYGIIA